MNKKILFLTFDPFSADKHITEEVKEYVPIVHIVSVNEMTIDEIPEDFDYDSISYVIDTAGAEYHKCKDEKRHSQYDENMIMNETLIDSKEQFSDQFDDPDEAQEEWMCYIIEACNDFFEHIYLIEVEIGGE